MRTRLQIVNGSGVRLKYIGGTDFYQDGYYYFKDHVNLSGIYTARCSSEIVAMALKAGTLPAEEGFEDWAAIIEVRQSEQLQVMADWTPALSSIDPDPIALWNTTWSNWRQFFIGDYTGKIYEFRVRLHSGDPTVTVFVDHAQVNVDMPDRTVNGYDLICPVGGLIITFQNKDGVDTPFWQKPSIQVTQDNWQDGDYYTITTASKSGFTIQFTNSTSGAVERQFDYSALGFGAQAPEII